VTAADDRNRAIERLLQQSFKTPAGPSDGCLDAETLAAWADGGLSGAARAMVESHVADCARCQAIVSTAARMEAIAPARAEPGPRRWFAWVVPLTAAAAAVAIWVAVPHRPDSRQPQQAAAPSQSVQAQAPDSPTPGAQLQEPAAPREAQPATAKSDQGSRDQAQAPELRKDSDRREFDRLKQEPQSADAAADRADKLRAAAEPVAAAPNAPVAPAAPSAPAARENFQARSNAVAAAEKTAAGGAVDALALTARWRISGTGLEHSTDGGSTWSAVASGVTSELTAVSSPSDTVCWVVGRGGVVLRTTDGRNFSRVAFPERTDLSAVQASDGQSATVTASDGRVFRTSNGGAAWGSR
jgi:hypothetical protein